MEQIEMSCSKCGESLPGNAAFCPKCGEGSVIGDGDREGPQSVHSARLAQASVAEFRQKIRISIMAFFLGPILALLAGNMIGSPVVISIGDIIAVVSYGVALYYYARSKGYNCGWSGVLAIIGLMGTLALFWLCYMVVCSLL